MKEQPQLILLTPSLILFTHGRFYFDLDKLVF